MWGSGERIEEPELVESRVDPRSVLELRAKLLDRMGDASRFYSARSLSCGGQELVLFVSDDDGFQVLYSDREYLTRRSNEGPQGDAPLVVELRETWAACYKLALDAVPTGSGAQTTDWVHFEKAAP